METNRAQVLRRMPTGAVGIAIRNAGPNRNMVRTVRLETGRIGVAGQAKQKPLKCGVRCLVAVSNPAKVGDGIQTPHLRGPVAELRPATVRSVAVSDALGYKQFSTPLIIPDQPANC